MNNQLELLSCASGIFQLTVDGEIDKDNELEIVMDKLGDQHVVYLTVTQTTQLRNHLTTLLGNLTT